MKRGIQIIRSIDDFKVIEEKWNALLKKSSNVSIFSTFEWYYSWWQAKNLCKENVQVIIILYYDNNNLIGAAPLMLSSDNKLHFLSSPTADYQDFVIDKQYYKEVIDRLLEFILRNISFKVIELNEVNSNSRTLKYFKKKIINHYRIGIHIISKCPYINLKDKTSVQVVLNKKNIEIKLRKLLKNGDAKFSHFFSLDDIKKELKPMKKFFADRWQKNSESWFFFEKFDNIFFDSLTNIMTKERYILLSKLSLNEEPLSYYFGFTYNNIYYFYRSSFNDTYKQYSPGHILLKYLIKHLVINNYEIFDMLRGTYQYKWDYAYENNINYRIMIVK